MIQGRRMAIADEACAIRAELRLHLERMGHQIVVDAATGNELVEGCSRLAPELIVADIRLAGSDGSEIFARATHERRVPMVIVADEFDSTTFNRVIKYSTFAYLLKPIRHVELEIAVALTLVRYEELAEAWRAAADKCQELADRKVIEQAKGLLMKRGRIDEPEAFARLRQSARQHRKKVVDIARSILMAEGMLHSDEHGHKR